MNDNHLLHPVHDVEQGCFNTNSKLKVDLNNPTADMICTSDIVHALSNICRFGGHTNKHYSVAQHTMLVHLLAPNHLKKAALIHDATEAYLGDVIKPLKVILGSSYADLEAKFDKVIFEKYGVDLALLNEIKPYDKEALEIEHNYFYHGNGRLAVLMHNHFSAHGVVWNFISCWSQLHIQFLHAFEMNQIQIDHVRALPQEIQIDKA